MYAPLKVWLLIMHSHSVFVVCVCVWFWFFLFMCVQFHCYLYLVVPAYVVCCGHCQHLTHNSICNWHMCMHEVLVVQLATYVSPSNHCCAEIFLLMQPCKGQFTSLEEWESEVVRPSVQNLDTLVVLYASLFTRIK